MDREKAAELKKLEKVRRYAALQEQFLDWTSNEEGRVEMALVGRKASVLVNQDKDLFRLSNGQEHSLIPPQSTLNSKQKVYTCAMVQMVNSYM